MQGSSLTLYSWKSSSFALLHIFWNAMSWDNLYMLVALLPLLLLPLFYSSLHLLQWFISDFSCPLELSGVRHKIDSLGQTVPHQL